MVNGGWLALLALALPLALRSRWREPAVGTVCQSVDDAYYLDFKGF